MRLDNTYGFLNILEFYCNHFLKSLFQAESEFKNSNFGGNKARFRWKRFSQDSSPLADKK